jgi:hypothetical protein
MPLVHLVIGLALLEFFLFGLAVARARHRYQVRPPATTGHEVFERTFRAQMNTLEQLVIFLPGFCSSRATSTRRSPQLSGRCSSSAGRSTSRAT